MTHRVLRSSECTRNSPLKLWIFDAGVKRSSVLESWVKARTAPLKVVAPVMSTFPVIVCPIVVIEPATSNAPEMFTASFNCISVLSAALIAVPFKVNAPITTFPVPLGCIEMSALEPFDEIAFVETEPAVIASYTSKVSKCISSFIINCN